MSPTAAWPASKPKYPGITPSSTTPHIPAIDGAVVGEDDVADAGAHDRDERARVG